MNEHQEHVYAIARQVWDSVEGADAFMTAPHALLGGKTPLEVAVTEAGARDVEAILRKLAALSYRVPETTIFDHGPGP